MILSTNPAQAADPGLSALRSLMVRGRHAEAERVAAGQRRRLCGAAAKPFLALRAEIALGLGRFASALEWASDAMRGLDPTDTLLRSIEGSRIRALLGLGRFREAHTLVESRFAPLDADGVDLSLFRGQSALHSGHLTEAFREAVRACTLAVSTRQRGKLVEALLLHSRAARESGDVERARCDLDRAERLSNGLRDAGALASVLSDQSDLMAHQGDWAEAGRNADQSGRLFARAGSPHEHLSAGRRTGLLGLAQGDPNLALRSIERAASVARRGFGSTQCRAEIDLLLSDAQLADKDPEGALDRATGALAFFRDAQDPGGIARAHVRRSLVALSAANETLALREAKIALAIKGAGPVALGLADLALGRVLLRRDRASAAAPFDRASKNPSLYPPLRSVGHLGVALSSGVSPQSDTVRTHLRLIEAFGDRRILAIVRSDLRELFGLEPSPLSDHRAEIQPTLPNQKERECEDESPEEFLPGLIGASPPVKHLSALVRKAAPSDLPVSIFGETGTGKENIARAIHDLSNRSNREFVAINAASLSDELFESELFGHVRGAFTGAQADRPGLVEKAKGGTLFIDEVADLSPRSQVRLLRFLQEGTYRRVGDNQERRADVRIVVAANRRLADLAAAGSFRVDLLHRMEGISLTVPPLCERGRDVVRLARHFVAQASDRSGRLSASSEAEIIACAWPGNVRQLQQEMRRAVVLGDGPIIEWQRPKTGTSQVAPGVSSGGASDSEATLREALVGFERTFLKSALARCAERVEAARMLGISRQALHQKIVRYGL